MHPQVRPIPAKYKYVPSGHLCGKTALSLAVLVIVLILHALNSAASGQSAGARVIGTVSSAKTNASASMAASYGKLRLSFEANQGQTEAQVHFLSRGNGYSLFITDTEAVLAMRRPAKNKMENSGHPLSGLAGKLNELSFKTDVVRMQLTGARADARVSGEDKLTGVANYFIGNNPQKWHSGVPTYGKVKYVGVYPGIDLAYYGNQQQLEYDFIVAPNADPRSIRLHFAGVQKLKLTREGILEVIARNGEIEFHEPVVYQIANGERHPVEGRFALVAKNSVGFELGNYDHSKPLVIDPTLSYSTYLGGSGNGGYGTAIAVDENGDAYVTGVVYSTDFPTTSGAYQTANKSGASTIFDAFVTKLNVGGTALVYSTYLGGSGNTSVAGTLNHGDYPTSIKVDSNGDAYLAGIAYSTDFPFTTGALQTVNNAGANGDSNCFVTKLNATGTALAYSTYLGGSGESGYAGRASLGDVGGDGCASIAVDASGDAYVTGTAYSSDFPTTSGAYQTTNKSASSLRPNAFAAKLNPEATALLYSTFLGGTNGDGGSGVALDASGNLYMAGATYSNDFPVTGEAYQATNNAYINSYSNAFITKLNATGSALVYSTYLGGTGNPNGPQDNNNGDVALSIETDSAGNAYVYGLTSSSDFPVAANAYQTTNDVFGSNSGPTFFVTKLNASGSALTYSTYVGGTGVDLNPGSAGMAVDSSGNAYFTGYVMGTDYPHTANAYQTAPVCALAADGTLEEYESPIFTELNPTGTGLVYSTYFGGSGTVAFSAGPVTSSVCDQGYGLALDSSSNIYLTGNTSSSNFPVTTGAYQSKNHSTTNAYVAKFASSSSVTVVSTTTSVSASTNPATAGENVTFTADVTPSSGPGTPTGTVSFSVDGGTGTSETLNSGEASYSTSTLTSGAHTITATYSGDSNYAASSGSLTETVNGASGAASIAVVSGSGQSATAGTAFTNPLVVIVKDTNGKPVSGASVSFTGSGLSFTSGTVTTGSDGTASTIATPTAAGSLTASAATDGVSASATFALTGNAFTVTAGAGIITTYAGDGTSGFAGDGRPAVDAELAQPVGLAMDSVGNLYVADNNNNRIRKITPAGVISTVAGDGTAGFSGDGSSATGAKLNGPAGVTIDAAGNLYFCDSNNHRVREVTPDGIISTFAGTGVGGYNGDGIAATGAELNYPNGIFADKNGNIYIADYFNLRVREVNAAGIISTVAGNGTDGYSGDGGPAIDAELNLPTDITIDENGNLYISDINNSRVRKVNTSGVISTFAGTGVGGYNGDGIAATSAKLYAPDRVAADSSGNIYISEYGNNRIRKVDTSGIISTIAGTGTQGFSGDGGLATSAEINTPRGLAVESDGGWFFTSDANNNRVREVQYQTYTPALSPAAGTYNSTQSVTITDGNAGAVIYYTTDGSAPTTSSKTYSGPISVSSSETLQAIAVAPNYTVSAAANAAYIINLPVPSSIGVVSGSGQTAAYGSAFANPLVVIVKDANGNPVPNAAVNFAGSGLSFIGAPATTGSNGEVSVTAKAAAVGSLTAVASTGGVTRTANFALTVTSLGTALTPAFTPGAGTYTSAQKMTISDSTPGAVIYYTIGTATPTATSTQYSGAITVGSTETINAIAVAPGYANSAVATAAYTISPLPASFTLSASPTTATIKAGKPATFTLTVTPQNGFTQAVSFSCSGLPSDVTCSFSPQTVTPAGAAVNTTLTIAAATEANGASLRLWERAGGSLAFAALLWPFFRRRRRVLCGVVLLSLSILFSIGCGGSPKAQSYMVTVTASSSSVTQTASLDLTVTQ